MTYEIYCTNSGSLLSAFIYLRAKLSIKHTWAKAFNNSLCLKFKFHKIWRFNNKKHQRFSSSKDFSESSGLFRLNIFIWIFHFMLEELYKKLSKNFTNHLRFSQLKLHHQTACQIYRSWMKIQETFHFKFENSSMLISVPCSVKIWVTFQNDFLCELNENKLYSPILYPRWHCSALKLHL